MQLPEARTSKHLPMSGPVDAVQPALSGIEVSHNVAWMPPEDASRIAGRNFTGCRAAFVSTDCRSFTIKRPPQGGPKPLSG
jgi:hypothetical protein